METAYNINKWSFIATLLLFLTFWGGIIAICVLAIVQIAISIKIGTSINKRTKECKRLFITYIISTISLIIIFKIFQHNGANQLILMFMWIIATMILAFFHLFITYKIKNDELSNS